MDKLEKYISAHSSPEDPLLAELDRVTHLRTTHPQMLCGHIQGKLLEMIVRMLRPRRVLEIGTFTGYSALCIATGLEGSGFWEGGQGERDDERLRSRGRRPWRTDARSESRDCLQAIPRKEEEDRRSADRSPQATEVEGPVLDTIEVDDELESIAREFFARSPHGDKIRLHIGSALEVAPRLAAEYDHFEFRAGREERDGERLRTEQSEFADRSRLISRSEVPVSGGRQLGTGRRPGREGRSSRLAPLGWMPGPYDLVFIDGDKREYPDYLRMVMGDAPFGTPLVHSGSFILADNILWYGKVADCDADGGGADKENRTTSACAAQAKGRGEEAVLRSLLSPSEPSTADATITDAHTRAIVQFNDMVAADPRLENVIIPLRDGLNLIRVIK